MGEIERNFDKLILLAALRGIMKVPFDEVFAERDAPPDGVRYTTAPATGSPFGVAMLPVTTDESCGGESDCAVFVCQAMPLLSNSVPPDIILKKYCLELSKFLIVM